MHSFSAIYPNNSFAFFVDFCYILEIKLGGAYGNYYVSI